MGQSNRLRRQNPKVVKLSDHFPLTVVAQVLPIEQPIVYPMVAWGVGLSGY
jgi:hypothetical protein